MKTFTDLSQSKKLARILRIDSADMRYTPFGDKNPWVWSEEAKILEKDAIPCWSLAALLCVLPPTVRLVGTSKDSYWYCECVSANNQEYAGFGSADNPVDACYEMIVKLNKHNLI